MMISKKPPPHFNGMKFQARTCIFLPIIRTSRSRISQQTAEEPSENEKQLILGQRGVGFGDEGSLSWEGRVRVPMMRDGWLREDRVLGFWVGGVEV